MCSRAVYAVGILYICGGKKLFLTPTTKQNKIKKSRDHDGNNGSSHHLWLTPPPAARFQPNQVSGGSIGTQCNDSAARRSRRSRRPDTMASTSSGGAIELNSPPATSCSYRSAPTPPPTLPPLRIPKGSRLFWTFCTELSLASGECPDILTLVT